MTLATWQGPFPAEVYGPHGKQRIEIGDTYDVGETELLSAHWKRAATFAPPAPAKSSPAETLNASDGGTD